MADSPSQQPTRRRALAVAGSLAAASSGAFHPLPANAADSQLVLRGVTIVDTQTGKLTPNMAIVIAGGKIGRIVPVAGFTAPASARTVDAHGAYVVPGYNDFHAHPLSSSDPEGSLTLMLANGVTGFREMASSPATLAARRAGTLMPAIPAPELLEIASETVSPGNSPAPAAAVEHVQKQIAQGADFIKVIEYRPDVFFAVAAECKRLNVRFIGHLNPAVDVRAAASAGMRSIEHMGPRDSILLGCSSQESALRPVPPPTAPPPPAAGPVSDAVIKRALANPTVNTPAQEIARYQRSIDTFDEARRQDLAAHFVAAGTWLAPTLIRVRTMLIGDDQTYRDDPNLQYVPAQTRQMWEEVSQQFGAKFTPAEHATLQALYAQLAKLVAPFKRDGVLMLAGSDLGGGFVIAGFGLHREFDLLEAAGVAPLDVLQMTTLNGAKFLGREATMGSVAVGKNANLVLLSANPVASIQNLHRIAGVVRAGTYYPASALAAMKQKTADRVRSGIAYTPPLLPPCC